MAVGFSGSNGGISKDFTSVSTAMLCAGDQAANGPPVEISFFVNNTCNLQCRHCYVGYDERGGSLTLHDWKSVFGSLIEAGALTFGNVGREPLLAWDTTLGLLRYFQERRGDNPRLRYGLVTNLTLLDDRRTREMASTLPDYIDVSLDGDEAIHDSIRGKGNYAATIGNLARLVAAGLGERIFISFTLNSENVHTVPALAQTLSRLGISRLLISPYISLDPEDRLLLPTATATRWVETMIDGGVIDFAQCRDMDVYFKNDFATSRHVMESWAESGIIRLDELKIDSYGVVFCKYNVNGSRLFFNYQVRDDFPWRSIRISHDGYVSSCLDMFHEDYRSRTLGNVKETPVLQILDRRNDDVCSISTLTSDITKRFCVA